MRNRETSAATQPAPAPARRRSTAPPSGSAPTSRVYERFTLGPGAIGWVFRYTNRVPVVRCDAVSGGLELSTQLAGRWVHRSAGAGERQLARAETFALSPTERYGYSYSADEGAGLQVGFLLYPDELPRLAGLDGLLRVAPGAFDDGGRFARLCADVARQAERGEPPTAEGLLGDLLAAVERHGEVVPSDPLLVAERELVRHLDRPLYLRHIADAAGMLPDTFYRQFSRRFGLGPTRYRLTHRLNAVARLVWSRPELTLADVAARAGFDDLSYLHRAFRAHFGVSPARYGRRCLDDADAGAA